MSKTFKSSQELLQEYIKTKTDSHKGEILQFSGVKEKDVYNPALVQFMGKIYLAGRVESRKNALDSSVVFFEEEKDGTWVPIKNGPVFFLEDPFFAKVGDELVFGGTEVEWKQEELDKPPILISFRIIFYKGKDIYNLKPFTKGPENMKDIRIVELHDKRIGVYTRPQGEKVGRGKIGFTIINSLEELTAEIIQKAPLLQKNFIDSDWGGVNAAYLLKPELLGVIGHISHRDQNDNLHYYAMAFSHNYKTDEISSPKIISIRDDFPATEAKTPQLHDVEFAGGFIKNSDGAYFLYAGISDTSVGRIKIAYPFKT